MPGEGEIVIRFAPYNNAIDIPNIPGSYFYEIGMSKFNKTLFHRKGVVNSSSTGTYYEWNYYIGLEEG